MHIIYMLLALRNSTRAALASQVHTGKVLTQLYWPTAFTETGQPTFLLKECDKRQKQIATAAEWASNLMEAKTNEGQSFSKPSRLWLLFEEE